MEIEFARDFREWIVFVCDRVRESLRDTAQKIGGVFLVVERRHKGKGVDEHAHRVSDLHIASAVGYSHDRHRILADEPAEGDVTRRQIDSRRRYAGTFRERFDRLDVDGHGHALFGVRKVIFEYIGDQGRWLFDLCHLSLEELFCFGRDLFLSRKIVVGIAFLFRLLAVQRFGELTEEDVNGRAVADEMVHVGEQDQFIGFDDLEPDAGTVLQVERLDKCSLVRLIILRRHFPDGDLRYAVGDRLLHDLVVAVGNETAEDIGVRVDHAANGFFKLFGADSLWEGQRKGDIVLNAVGICLTLGIDALLGKAEPAGLQAALFLDLRLRFLLAE